MTIKADYTRSDIVEELRYAAQWAEAERDILDPRYAAEAADEIERLRAENVALRQSALQHVKEANRHQARLAVAVEVLKIAEAFINQLSPAGHTANIVRAFLAKMETASE